LAAALDDLPQRPPLIMSEVLKVTLREHTSLRWGPCSTDPDSTSFHGLADRREIQ